MKVQTKIILLLVAIVATFLIGLWSFRLYDRQKFRQIADRRFSERSRSFDDFLSYYSQSLKTLALDYTLWDQMVEAIARRDDHWFQENAGDATLEGFHANAIWIYAPDGARVYQLNNLGSDAIKDVPLTSETIAQVFAKNPLAHFFADTAQGLMEIRGGAIHASRDFGRASPPQGYFFAGRLWSQPLLREMAMFTSNEINLVSPPPRVGENSNDEENGVIVFSKPLLGTDGAPVAQLVVRNESHTVRELNRSSQRLLLWLIAFSLVVLLLVAIALVRWVSRPLRRSMDSLRRGDPQPILGLCEDKSEFGELARTIRAFFEQRDNLFREMDERRQAEERLRKREEELRQSQKMEAIGRLAGGVAHDFNNLLTAIIGYAELINARQPNDSHIRQHAALIHKAGEQAATLTHQLLAFSRKQMLQPRVIDLNQLVVDMQQLLRRVIGERFDLQTKAEAELGRVMADPNQIEQVILNLSVNARDAMPNGGRVTIRTANLYLERPVARRISSSLQAGDYVELSVSDNGVGMSEETKTHIFEPFFTTKPDGQGTGLGLATVYGIVRQTGGAIAVESEPRQGSTFRIYLPLERRAIEPRSRSGSPVEKAANFETVLVVEDEEIVRDLVCDVLSEQGYNVLCAMDGLDGLRVAEQFDEEIDLLLTDVVMPHMNGPELAERLCAVRPGLKVLFISGYPTDDMGDHRMHDQRLELLQKPFTPQVLARKVRDVMEEERAQVAAAAAR